MNHPDGECPTPEKPAAPKVLTWTVLGATLIVAAFVHFYGHVRLNILTWQGGSGSGRTATTVTWTGLALLQVWLAGIRVQRFSSVSRLL